MHLAMQGFTGYSST